MEVDLAEMEDVKACAELTVPLKRMPHNSAASTFAVLEREEGSLAAGSAPVVMHFTQKARDASTGDVEDEGYAEEYQLEEDLEVCFLPCFHAHKRVQLTVHLSLCSAAKWEHSLPGTVSVQPAGVLEWKWWATG